LTTLVAKARKTNSKATKRKRDSKSKSAPFERQQRIRYPPLEC
jgi:hypothetical protein